MESTVTLRTADLTAILNAAETADRLMPAEAAIYDLLEALSALVSCDLLFWTRFDVQIPYKIAEVGYPHAPRAAGLADWIVHRPEHPICSGLHGPVVSLSDVIDPAEFHHTWLYEESWVIRMGGAAEVVGKRLEDLRVVFLGIWAQPGWLASSCGSTPAWATSPGWTGTA